MSQKNSAAMNSTPENEFATAMEPEHPAYTEPEGFFEKLFCGLFTDCASQGTRQRTTFRQAKFY
jgi:hypothetical protein